MHRRLLLTFLVIGLAGCAGIPKDSPYFAEVVPPDGYAVLYVYQEPRFTTSPFGNLGIRGFLLQIQVDGHLVVKLPTALAYSYVFLRPGSHTITEDGFKMSPHVLELTAGKSYILQFTSHQTLAGTRMVFTGSPILPMAAQPDYNISLLSVLHTDTGPQARIRSSQLIPPLIERLD